MSKKTTFLALLENAQNQTGEDRFKALAVAADCAEEMEESEWPNVKMLVCLLKFMLKHKKFPGVEKKVRTSRTYAVPFDTQAAKAEFLESLGKSPVRGSIDRRLSNYVKRKRAEHHRLHKPIINKEEVTEYTVYIDSLRNTDFHETEILPDEEFPFAEANNISPGGYRCDSLESCLNFLMEQFSPICNYFLV